MEEIRGKTFTRKSGFRKQSNTNQNNDPTRLNCKEGEPSYLRPAMPMSAQYSRSKALAFTTCSSLRPEYPELPPLSILLSLGQWVLRERGRMATNSSSSCLRICHSTELLSLLRWQHRQKVKGRQESWVSIQGLILWLPSVKCLAFVFPQ